MILHANTGSRDCCTRIQHLHHICIYTLGCYAFIEPSSSFFSLGGQVITELDVCVLSPRQYNEVSSFPRGVGILSPSCAAQLFDLLPKRPFCFLTMHRRNQSFNSSIHTRAFSNPISFQEPASAWSQTRQKSSGGARPKKKIYHRVPELDKVVDLNKKPSLILQLKCIIQSQKTKSLLLRDLEKEVGFVSKWNFMAVIEKYPPMFYVGGGANRTPPYVRLTEKAEKIAALESEARNEMEPILVKNLRKLLMLSVDCRVPLEKIEFIESELGLPDDFKESIIAKYPEYFSVKDVKGKDHLLLENWDPSLAVTARETNLMQEGVSNSGGYYKKVKITKDGNYLGPFAFKINFPPGFRPNKSYLEELEKWQKLDFPSPYLNARRFEAADPKARKRGVAVLHELLSLTMEKRMTSAQLNAFYAECHLPSRLLLCLIKHHGIFYLTNKGARGTVFLKEAYDGSNLINKCPLLLFHEKFVALSGRKSIYSGSGTFMPENIS